jgi:hypothetical protein
LTTKLNKDTKEGTKEKKMRASRRSPPLGVILDLAALVSLVIK